MRVPVLCVLVSGGVLVHGASRWDWEDNIGTLVPSLPIAAPLSKNKICRDESRRLVQNLRNFTLWAMQMWDASAKRPVGLLSGNTFELGDFDECSAVRYPVRAQYCLATITMEPPRPAIRLQTTPPVFDPRQSAWDTLQFGGDMTRVRRDTIHWALCVPASCSGADIEAAVTRHLQRNGSQANFHISIPHDACHGSRDDEPITTADTVFLHLMLTLLALVILASFVDFQINDTDKPATHLQMCTRVEILLCFSARRNFRRILGSSSSMPNQLDVLNSIKFLCMCLIIIDHRGASLMAGPLQNPEFVEQEFHTLRFTFMLRGDILVDTFFVMSGILVTHVLLQELPRFNINPVFIVLLRFLRLAPAMMVVVFFYSTWLYKLGDGPRWESVIGQERDHCVQNWWANLLFVNNYFNSERLCLLQSYYLACDMHFFVAALPLVWLLSKRPALGVNVLVLLTLSSATVPFLITYLGRKPALTRFFIGVVYDVRLVDVFQTVYIKSHARASPYFVGMLTGYLIYRLRDTKAKLPAFASLVLFAGSVAVLLVTMFSGALFYDMARPYSPLEAGMYAGFHRLVWALATSLFILTLIYGRIPLVSCLFSWRPLVLLGNLVYGLFLTHAAPMYRSLGMLRTPVYLGYFESVSLFGGDMLVSLLFALLLFLSVEEPCRLLTKLCFFPSRKHTTAKQS